MMNLLIINLLVTVFIQVIIQIIEKIDNMNTEDAIKYLKEECDFYINDIEYSENSHIIGLVTCDYSIKNRRLIVFYISE